MSHRIAHILGAALSATALATGSAIAADHPFHFQIVDYPGASGVNIYAINDLRQYVGSYFDADGGGHAIFFNGRTLAALDPAGPVGTSADSYALSINGRSEIVGTYADAGGTYHGYLYRHGKVTLIDVPGALLTEAFGINDLDEVIGLYRDSAQVVHAFLMVQGQFQTIDLPGAVRTIPFSINNRRDIVGEEITTPGTTGHGYLQTRSGRLDIVDAPGAAPDSTFFISINVPRQILGSYDDAGGATHNFVLDHGRYQPFEVPHRFGATLVSVQTINDRGDIVGYYNDAQNVAHGFVARRPEPFATTP